MLIIEVITEIFPWMRYNQCYEVNSRPNSWRMLVPVGQLPVHFWWFLMVRIFSLTSRIYMAGTNQFSAKKKKNQTKKGKKERGLLNFWIPFKYFQLILWNVLLYYWIQDFTEKSQYHSTSWLNEGFTNVVILLGFQELTSTIDEHTWQKFLKNPALQKQLVNFSTRHVVFREIECAIFWGI